ncbi:MAG TPA: hypothetical protein VGL53_00190 [Bryobacteraceae bacterium]|jgi:hypothetical protein
MLKTECLPAEQQYRNAALNRDLSKLGIATLLLFLVAAGGLTALAFLWPNNATGDSEVATPDGTILGVAIIVGPNLVLTDADVTGAAQLLSPGVPANPLTKIRSEKFEENVSFTLLRTDRPIGAKDILPIGTVDPAVQAHVQVASGVWDGNLKARPSGPYFDFDPSLPLGPGLPVQQNHTLAAVSAQTGGNVVAVPLKHLMTKFKELSAGQ